MLEKLESNKNEDIILSGKELDDVLGDTDVETASKLNASESFDEFSDGEEVKLSNNEMDNILDRADISELKEGTLTDNESLEDQNSNVSEHSLIDPPTPKKEELEENDFLKSENDEIIALSELELDDILENVDETQVVNFENNEESEIKLTDVDEEKQEKQETSQPDVLHLQTGLTKEEKRQCRKIH